MFGWVHSGAQRRRRVHSRSHGFARAGLGVFGFISVRLVSLGSA